MYYYGSRRNEAGKLIQDRKSKCLNQYPYTNPKSKQEKQHNKETLLLIEKIKSKRIAEAASGQHSFTDNAKSRSNLYRFFTQIMETKKTNESSSNYFTWEACLVQLKRYHPDESLTFEQVTVDWVDGVRRYFDTQAKTKSDNLISKNTASTYFNKIRAVINVHMLKESLPVTH